jgi:Dolichyl-phosphate-mannose-protein mannosyltransferase
MEVVIEKKADTVANLRPQFRFLAPQTALAGLALACVVLFSLYVRVADYGFYEDDYWGIVPWFKKSPAEMWAMTISHLSAWPTGRPLNHILPKWFSWLGYHLAGVQGIYFLGFLVHSTNAFLLYLLLRRWLGHWSAVLAGCLFVLIPADTTRIFLLHNAHIHSSLAFLIIALLVIRTRYWALSYPIAGLALLSYETAFLPFIVFPLFFADRQKRILQWFRHLTSCGVILAIVFGIRLHLGDARANSVVSGPGETLWRMVSSMWIGPETSLKTLVKAVLEAPHSQPPFAFLFAGLVVIALILASRLIRDGENGPTDLPNRREIIKVFLAGLASWVFAYALTLTNYPPTQLAGRLTSTHIAAVFGLTCVLAAGAAYLRSLGDLPKVLTTGATAVLVALFTLYSFRIQSGYAFSWAQERAFWKQVIQLCPDITPKTRIILIGKEPRQNQFILANSWADLHVLEDAFATPEHPLLFYYDGLASLAEIRTENGQITWKPFFWRNQREILNLDDVIILKDDGTDITRISEFQIPGTPFPLRTKPLASVQAQASLPPLTDFGRFLLAE